MYVYQSPRNAEMALLKVLQAGQGLKVMGCRFHRGLIGGVGVSVPNRALGLWRYKAGGFEFIPHSGEGVEARVQTVNDAVDCTVSIATWSYRNRSYH